MARKSATRKAASSKSRRARRAQGRDDWSDGRKRRRAEKVEAASKKGGCAPKLFMLLLPFAATGTYLLLRA